LRPLTVRVVTLFLACLAVIIILQSFGLSPAGEVRR
jgi:hypothetical protein